MGGAGRPGWRWPLVALLVLIAAFTGYHVVRSVQEFLFWRSHRDEPIQPWMRIGFVARAFRGSRDAAAVGPVGEATA